MTLNLPCLAELSLVGETVRPIHKKKVKINRQPKDTEFPTHASGLLIYPMEPVCSCFTILNSLHLL